MTERTHAMALGFDRVADRYERGRPGYPTAAVERLAKALDIAPGRDVVDVGAGTGKFTRELRRFGSRLTAVEPLPKMRARFVEQLPDVPLLEGTAEQLPLPDASADAIVCAQAFHWFDTPRAAREFARVLRPEGGLGLIWNVRDEHTAWVAELTRILDRHDAGGPRGRSQAWRAPFEATGLFTELQKETFPHVQEAPPETIVDRALSVSFIAMLPSAEQEVVAGQVRDLLARSPETRGRELVQLPYRTDVWWARRSSRSPSPAAAASGPS